MTALVVGVRRHDAQVLAHASTGLLHSPSRSRLRDAQVYRSIRPVPSLLTQTRKSRGLSLDQVAAAVKTDPTNLSRVEKGTQIPKRDLARRLFLFYGRVVPLGVIFDPEFDADAFAHQLAEEEARAAAEDLDAA